VPHNQEAIEDSLNRVLGDAALRSRLREGCAEVALGLSWEQPIEQIEALYSGLLAGRLHP